MPTNRPPYGVGMAYRPNLHREIMHYRNVIDVLEVPTIDYIDRYWRLAQDPLGELLRQALNQYPAVAHGISMSIGSVESHDELHLKQTRKFMDDFGIEEFSEHLAFHRMDGNDLKSFIAMPFDEVSLDWLVQKYEVAKAILGRPFALENVSYYFTPTDCEMDEADFINELARRTDCSILLDVTNVFNNAENNGYDAVEYIQRMPGDRIEQLHIAGGELVRGTWLDSHNATVMEPVWDLVHEALRHTNATSIFLERDSDFYPFESILDDLVRAREVFYEHRPAEPADSVVAHVGTDEVAADAPGIDPLNDRYANLRSYQRAVLGQVTDLEFARTVAQTPEAVQERFPMSPEWQTRWQGCDQRHIKAMSRKWPETLKREQEMEEELKRLEWQMWSRQGG